MRKSLWIILAAMVVAVIAPTAHADEFQYTYTVTAPSFFALSWETVPIPGVTAQVVLFQPSLASMTITGLNLVIAGCSETGASVGLDLGGAGNQTTELQNCGIALVDNFNLPLTDYTTPGTYFWSDPNLSAELEVRAVATPEPSSVALMLLGVGLVFVMRKRIGQGLPQAS